MHSEFLVAIPVYNEERYVAGVLEQVRRHARDILVVNDGSTDRTPALLRRERGIRVITHPENLGYGQSLADIFDYAHRHAYRWLVTMDCDEQHEPACIPCFMEVARAGGVEVVSGTRYPDGHEVLGNAPPDRREINRRITALINERLELGITDAFCGFKAYCVPSLRHIRVTIPGYAMPMQWWVQVARAGLRVRELPVRLIYVDPTRHFGGVLDNPEARYNHYLEVFESEWAQPAIAPAPRVERCSA
jgi:dolichol-phosphate mannosyltransferase